MSIFILSAVAPMAMAPPDQTYSLGDTVSLQCNSTGGPGNSYQWRVNGSDLGGENSPMLVLNSVSASTGGEYSCVVRNAAGSNTDNTNVFISPYITSQPLHMVGANGSMTMLTCEAEAFPSPQYQWGRMDGDKIRAELSTTSSTLMFTPLLFGDEGEYFCNATSRNLTTQSQPATLTGKDNSLQLYS